MTKRGMVKVFVGVVLMAVGLTAVFCGGALWGVGDSLAHAPDGEFAVKLYAVAGIVVGLGLFLGSPIALARMK